MTRTLEISAHLYGGTELGSIPRDYRGGTVEVPDGSAQWLTLDATTTARVFLRLTMDSLEPLPRGWLSARVALEDMNGWLIGTRPALIYDRPYDVPTHVHFHTDHFHAAVALRRTA